MFTFRRATIGIACAALAALTAGARGISAAATPVSDDFNAVTLNTNLWTIYNPAGDGSVTPNGSALQLSLPAGQPHDLWTGGNQSLRILQPMANGDFYVEVKFDSPVANTIQDQGIIVAQDTSTYVRFDVYRNGSSINYFSASFVNNKPTVRVSHAITVTSWPIYLRARRQGNTWTGMWSTDGINFAVATQFALNMTAAQIGPFAANNGSPAPAFTASIDYFHNLLDDGSGSGPGTPGVADLTASISHSANFISGSQGAYTISAGNAGSAASSGTVTIADSLPAGLTPVSAAGSGWACGISGQTATCNTAAAIAAGQSSQPITVLVNVTGAAGTVTNTVTVSGGSETNTANNSASDATTITSGQTSSVTPVTDEFNAVALNTNLWTIYNPAGDGSVTLNGSNLLLAIPAGQKHDLWTSGNESLRILQPMTNGDFYVEVKFDSPVSTTIQDQGIIVAQDTGTYVRFDVYRNGSAVNYYSASFVNNNPTVRVSRAITVNSWPIYLRAQRQGSTWTGTWSTDGVNFVAGTQFTLNMTAAQIGPFAANSGSSAPAFTGSIDYFRNLLDGSGNGPGNPGEPGTPDLTVSLSHASNFVTGSQGDYTIRAANAGSATSSGQITITDSLPAGLTPTSATGSGWACGISGQTVTCNSSAIITAGQSSPPITLLVNIAAGPRSITNIASVSGGGEINTANNSASDPTTVTGTTDQGQGPISDDFHSSTLNSALWTFVNPKGDGSVKLENNHALISVPAGNSHDIWTGGNNSARLMQPVANKDFDVELKLDSTVDLPCQMQGLLVQQDLNNYLRFDVYSSGTYAHLFVASFVNGMPTALLDKVIGNGIPLPYFVRVRRTGDTFSYQRSTDGYNFSEAVHFTRRLTVSQIGPFAGNSACGYTAPAFTSSIDYFFNTATPIVPQDGVAGTNPVINVWYGDNQTFGQNGIPQTWINILGTVLSPTGSLKSLQYKLNGGSAQSLWVGADTTRLNQPGDFNVEIAYTSLKPGANTVSIIATDQTGNQTTHNVTVNYVTGKTWPLPYTITWTPSTKLQDVVQVVDGKWEIESDGTVRTKEIGYDRLLDIGDMSRWKDYLVTAEVTVHYITDSKISPPAGEDNGFGVGIVVGWKGHTKDVFGRPSSEQPGVGHPFPAVGWYSNTSNLGPYLNLYQNTPSHQERVMAYLPSDGLALKFETKYIFKMQVKANPDNRSSHFSFKAWPASSPEPSQWSVQADGDLSQGSVVLGAHRTDVSFGKVTVTPAP